MKLYREVKASERLPDEKSQHITNYGYATYHPLLKEWRQEVGESLVEYEVVDIFWWLEPIEITEEEIIEMAAKEYPYCDEETKRKIPYSYPTDIEIDCDREDFILGAKAILSKLKGDEEK